ncbi:MAG: ZIP family metal transporter [Eubacteriales bacterium]|nr:ZIP family metal transporter [Eubacteriales bacterium]
MSLSTTISTLAGVLIPFAGTTLGAACVFFLRGEMRPGIRKILTGFAAGVMVAASFWSLLSPSLDMAEPMGRFAFVPAAAGFLVGMFFLLVLDLVTPHMHLNSTEEGPQSGIRRTTKLILAVTLHNIPEGMAVGVVYAGWLNGDSGLTAAGALALSLGIAIQNFPEGAIVSMPLRAEGMSKPRTFLYGMLSGIVEPAASLLTIAASSLITGMLPCLLSFAAGAMMYVVVEELIPEMSEEPHSNLGPVAFAFGFVLMMILDVTLG